MANEQNAANAKAVKTYIKKGIGKVRVWIGSGLLAAADVAKVLGLPSGNTLIIEMRIPDDQHCHLTNEQNRRTVPCLTVEGVRTAVHNRRTDGHQMTAFVEERINRFVDWFEQELAPAATEQAEPVEIVKAEPVAEAEYKTIDAGPFGAIRVIIIGDKILFVAQDIARGLGHKDAYYMVRLLDKDEVTSMPWNPHKVGEPQVDDLKSKQPTICITEPGLYHAFNMRRTQCINDPDVQVYIDNFQRTMNHKVLPQITRTGAYIPEGYQAPALPTSEDEIISSAVEQSLAAIKILQNRLAAAEQKAKVAEENATRLEAENDTMRDKAHFADAITGNTEEESNKKAQPLSVLAVDLVQAGAPDIGLIRLCKRLKDDGYIKRGPFKHYLPTQRSLDLKVMVKHEKPNKSGFGPPTSISTWVTGKGREYFVNKYAPEGQRKLIYLEELKAGGAPKKALKPGDGPISGAGSED